MRFIFYFDILSYIGYTLKSRLIEKEDHVKCTIPALTGDDFEIQFSKREAYQDPAAHGCAGPLLNRRFGT